MKKYTIATLTILTVIAFSSSSNAMQPRRFDQLFEVSLDHLHSQQHRPTNPPTGGLLAEEGEFGDYDTTNFDIQTGFTCVDPDDPANDFLEEPADLDAFIEENGPNARINGMHVAYYVLLNGNGNERGRPDWNKRRQLLALLKEIGIDFYLPYKEGEITLYAQVNSLSKRRRTRRAPNTSNTRCVADLAKFLLS